LSAPDEVTGLPTTLIGDAVLTPGIAPALERRELRDPMS
jgi:hypothetical protein